MLRIGVLIVLLGGAAYADELSKGDIQDQEKRIDARSLAGYDHAVDSRDVFASLHDSVYHPAFQALKASRTAYDAKHAELDKLLAANDIPKATAALDALEAAGNALGDKLEAYRASSADGVQKIQIGLGVLAFVIGGLVVWLVKRRRKR